MQVVKIENSRYNVNILSLRGKLVSYQENKLPTIILACWTSTHLRTEFRCKSAKCSWSSGIRLKAYARICRRIWHKLHIPEG